MRHLGVALFSAVWAGTADASVQSVDYDCGRGVVVSAVYVNGDDAGEPRFVAVLQAEGRLISLAAVESGSGTRYAEADDGAGYIWWTKGDSATLIWSAPDVADVTIYQNCRAT